MILLNWERTEGEKKKQTPQQQNWHKEIESSKIPNSAKGDQQCWFSLRDSLIMGQEFRGVRCSQINISRVIPVEQDTLNEAFCASSGTRGKFAHVKVLEMWPPLQQPQNLVEMTRKTNFHRGNCLARCCPSRRRHFSLILAFLKQCSNTAVLTRKSALGNMRMGGIWGLTAQKEPQQLPRVSIPDHSHLNGFRFDTWMQLKNHYFYKCH